MGTDSNLEAALDEAGKVIKKQKVSAGKVSDALDKLIQLAQQSRQQLAAGSSDVINQLKAQAEQLGLVKEMNSSTKEFHSSINKLSKVRAHPEASMLSSTKAQTAAAARSAQPATVLNMGLTDQSGHLRTVVMLQFKSGQIKSGQIKSWGGGGACALHSALPVAALCFSWTRCWLKPLAARALQQHQTRGVRRFVGAG
jgi:hypothetical protein